MADHAPAGEPSGSRLVFEFPGHDAPPGVQIGSPVTVHLPTGTRVEAEVVDVAVTDYGSVCLTIGVEDAAAVEHIGGLTSPPPELRIEPGTVSAHCVAGQHNLCRGTVYVWPQKGKPRPEKNWAYCACPVVRCGHGVRDR
jgi:hypothetical protein